MKSRAKKSSRNARGNRARSRSRRVTRRKTTARKRRWSTPPTKKSGAYRKIRSTRKQWCKSSRWRKAYARAQSLDTLPAKRTRRRLRRLAAGDNPFRLTDSERFTEALIESADRMWGSIFERTLTVSPWTRLVETVEFPPAMGRVVEYRGPFVYLSDPPNWFTRLKRRIKQLVEGLGDPFRMPC